MAASGAGPSNDRSDGLIGHTLAGRYAVEGRLGKGGMAVVYKARDRSFGRTVAIKVLRTDVAKDPVAAKRLVREARAAGQLHHPNIITMHDVGETDGMVYIVMELMKGRELAELMEEEGAIGVRRALGIGRQVAAALTIAHQHGIIHRDIKPENLFLIDKDSGEDFVKMLDFSIAKLPTNMVTAALTRAGSVFGTPHYMAPEQVEGRTVCPQTDLYALGAVIYELIAGEPPFDGDSVIDILLQHAKKQAPKLKDLRGVTLPAGVSELVDSMLAKKEAERPATAADVETALTRLIEEFAPPPPVAPDPDRTVALTPISVPDGAPPSSMPAVVRPAPRPPPAHPPEPPAPGPGLDLPDAPPQSRREASSGPEEGTLIGHGLAAQVRAAAEKMAAEQAAAEQAEAEQVAVNASTEDEPTRIEQPAMDQVEPTRLEQPAAAEPVSFPPPPPGRAKVPGVFAPGAMGPSGGRGSASASLRAVPDAAPPPPPPPPPAEALVGADSVPTAPEISVDDVSKLQRASQDTVAISPTQMRYLSQKMKRPRRQSSMLLWFAVPAAAFGVIAILVAVYLLISGQ